MSRIVSVTPKENTCLLIALDNGRSIVLNLSNRLHTIRFSLLADADFFSKVTTDGAIISWEGKVEISLTEALQMAQKTQAVRPHN